MINDLYHPDHLDLRRKHVQKLKMMSISPNSQTPRHPKSMNMSEKSPCTVYVPGPFDRQAA